MNKRIKLFFALFLLCIFTINAQGMSIGANAPDFSLELQSNAKPSGDFVKLSDYKGKALFLHFWATWCPPCKVELPHMEKLSQKIQAKGSDSKIVFLAICISDSQKSFSSFMEKNKYTFTGGLDASGAIARKYGIQGIPTSILISPEGKILKINVGMMSEKQLEKFVEGYGV